MIDWHTVAFVLIVAAIVFGGSRQIQLEKRNRLQGNIYFIKSEAALMIKVGRTKGSPMDRLRELQTGSPDPLRLVMSYKVDNAPLEEARWHNLLAEYRIRGEWFDAGAVERMLDRGAYVSW